VLTSQQFIIGCIAAVGNDWGFHTFMTLGPKYLKGALGFDVEKVGYIYMTYSEWLTLVLYIYIYQGFLECEAFWGSM
jgi:hypothetical protein